jgi:hypothetical protein
MSFRKAVGTRLRERFAPRNSQIALAAVAERGEPRRQNGENAHIGDFNIHVQNRLRVKPRDRRTSDVMYFRDDAGEAWRQKSLKTSKLRPPSVRVRR